MMSVSAGTRVGEQRLDRLRRDRVQGRGGLVEQQHIGAHGQRAGQAQQLLLASREAKGESLKRSLTAVPQADLVEALLGHQSSCLPLAIRWAFTPATTLSRIDMGKGLGR